MWKLDTDRPIYLQLSEHLELAICSGIYQPGERIPSVRELAAEAGVNPNTMQRALAELERKNVIVTFRTNGRTVTEDETMIKETRNALAKEQVHDFLKKMKEMGFEKEEIVDLLKEEEQDSKAN
ncbi:MAG: GntR family transcriptional regulator [Lachnospiraceae bacterium]|nr:GntR family transcriptional regulator [Lachnospiraceae bacterium]